MNWRLSVLDKNIKITTQEAKQAARKFTQGLMNQGYKPTGFYEYTDEKENPSHWRFRLDHPTKGKWFSPLSFNGSEWVLKEPKFPKGGKPLYRLHEIVSRPDETVWIVEGEKCADAFAALGLLATTSGSATTADGADWSVLSGRRIIIWPDNDQPGNQYANDVAKALVDIAKSVEVVDLEPLNLHEHGDCFDWLQLNPNSSRTDIDNLKLLIIEAPELVVEEWEEPRPLQRPLADAEPFPIEVLGETLGTAALKMAEVIQAPLAICGQSVLAAAALAVQGHANVEIDGRVSPLSEFFLTIGESGERKSAVDKFALAPHYEHQKNLGQQYKEDCKKYAQEQEAFKKEKEEVLRKVKGYPAKKEALRDLGDEPEPPLQPFFIIEEPTYEGLVKLLEIGQASQGLFSDEGGRFIGGHGMSNENALKTAAGLSGLWDGKPISRVRAGDGSSLLDGRRVSFHLMAQPNVAQMLLSNSELMEQGLLSRCLDTFPCSTAGHRLYRETNINNCSEMQRYKSRMTEILNCPLPTGDSKNELEPYNLNLTPDAKELWIKFHDAIEVKLGKDGILSPVKGLGNKAPEHAARLAGIIAVFNHAEISKISNFSIGVEAMAGGISLMKFYLNEALRLFNAKINDPTLSLAQEAYDWMKKENKSVISLVELYQYGPNAIRDVKTARPIMKILVEHGWAKPIADGAVFDGVNRRDAYEIRI
jgi:hypothetical protein